MSAHEAENEHSILVQTRVYILLITSLDKNLASAEAFRYNMYYFQCLVIPEDQAVVLVNPLLEKMTRITASSSRTTKH